MPSIEQTFGSGGRSAALLSLQNVATTLRSRLPSTNPRIVGQFGAIARQISFDCIHTDEIKTFEYVHQLRTPYVVEKSKKREGLIASKAEKIIAFNTFEGPISFEGELVVFDPQGQRLFSDQTCIGPSAKKIAICLKDRKSVV